MDNCVKCKQPGMFKMHEWYCNRCFCEVIEKRLRKHLSENPIIKGEHLIVFGDLAQHVLRVLIKDLPVTITLVQTGDELQRARKQYPKARCILPETMEDKLVIFLQGFFHGHIETTTSQDIMLFQPITIQELLKYAELKELPLPAINHHELLGQLNKFEEKYPSAKHGLLNSAKAINNILQSANVKKLAETDSGND